MKKKKPYHLNQIHNKISDSKHVDLKKINEDSLKI